MPGARIKTWTRRECFQVSARERQRTPMPHKTPCYGRLLRKRQQGTPHAHDKRKKTPVGKVRCFGIIPVITCNGFGRRNRQGTCPFGFHVPCVQPCGASGRCPLLKEGLLALTCSTRKKTRQMPAGVMCRGSLPRHPSCGGIPADILPCCRLRGLGCLERGQAGAQSRPGESPAR